MSDRAAPTYHHGDLPATLVRTAMAMLDADGEVELSLRAVAREAGVSTAAPYRHFPDRVSLLSAIAAVGYEEFMTALAERHPEPAGTEDLAEIAVTYVEFALSRPGLFRVMFAEGCDRTSPDRVAAVEAIHGYLNATVQRAVDTPDPASTATGLWALVHGLAFLYLDGKLDAPTPEDRDAQVRRTVRATLAAQVLEVS